MISRADGCPAPPSTAAFAARDHRQGRIGVEVGGSIVSIVWPAPRWGQGVPAELDGCTGRACDPASGHAIRSRMGLGHTVASASDCHCQQRRRVVQVGDSD